jgi:hypothetical protein
MAKQRVRLVLILSLVVWTTVWGEASGTLLQCLGQEEARIHRLKIPGVIYRLNQQMIAAITAANELNLRPKYQKNICHNPQLSPSVALLKELLLHQERVFKFKSSEHRQKSSFTVNQLISNLPNLFFNYLSGLQQYADKANCLPTKLPHLRYFMDRFKYLQGHFTGVELLNEKRKIQELFDALPQLDTILASCRN